MTFSVDDEAIEQIAALPAVRQACETAAHLIELWPLTDASQMDNDAKYAENLQVRITRTMAAMLTGQDVTMPDAEFVYEGADEIPGRPQNIVDALLAANDAYDVMAEYSDTGDPQNLFDAADNLNLEIDADTETGIRQVLASVDAAVSFQSTNDDHVPPTDNVDELARRFALVITACDALLTLFGADNNNTGRGVPVLLYANDLGERLSIPRVFMNIDDFRALLDAHTSTGPNTVPSEKNGSALAMAQILAPAAAHEWNHHREDVLWDAAEAKKRAKEEDERKNKEALAAKFAHVKDDPNKVAVEEL